MVKNAKPGAKRDNRKRRSTSDLCGNTIATGIFSGMVGVNTDNDFPLTVFDPRTFCIGGDRIKYIRPNIDNRKRTSNPVALRNEAGTAFVEDN